MNSSFVTRAVSFTAIIAMLLGYNQVLYAREKDEEIARLEAELAAAEQAAAATAAQSELYKDGTYNGSGEGFGGAIDVAVTVENGSIASIDILSHDGEDGPYFAEAVQIVEDMLNEQSADVDTISGATFSSTGIRTAVAEALEKAEA
ncbi:MAG: FMN-binding protein [Lachnospiraceae bacterium]|nr:FMN-binding protein [Lachnospiraceae bacterium]